MDDREKIMISLGLPTPCSSNSSMTFIGREAYQKELEAKMVSKVVKFPHYSTPEGLWNCIKLLVNLNALLDVALLLSKSSKYGSMEKLKVIYYNITNVKTPNKEDFNILKKMTESSIIS